MTYHEARNIVSGDISGERDRFGDEDDSLEFRRTHIINMIRR